MSAVFALSMSVGCLEAGGPSGSLHDPITGEDETGTEDEAQPMAPPPMPMAQTPTPMQPTPEVVPGPGEKEPAPEPPPPPGTLSLALSKGSDAIRLNEEKEYEITLSPQGNVSGAAALSIEGLPENVTAELTPESVTLSAEPVTVKLKVQVAPEALTTDAPIALVLKAQAGAVEASTTFSLSIPKELLLTIAPGVDVGANQVNPRAFGTDSITVHYTPGLKVTFLNMDGNVHRIHSNGALGIGHEPDQMAASGGSYTQEISGVGEARANAVHCHIHPGMVGPAIHVIP